MWIRGITESKVTSTLPSEYKIARHVFSPGKFVAQSRAARVGRSRSSRAQFADAPEMHLHDTSTFQIV